MPTFGHFDDAPVPYTFNGQAGWFRVPRGYSWFMMADKDHQIWVSPNELTKNEDGTVSGSPLYAAETCFDGTLVFQDMMAARQLGIDSPPNDRLSPFA